MISTITNIGLTEEQQKCIEYSIIYDDGTKLHAKDILKIGAKKSIKLSIKYKDDINPEYLPQEEKTIDLIFKVEYVQADETGHEKFKPIMKLYAYGSTEDYHAYKNNITKIVTKTNTSVPESAIESWDVSASGDGSVVAYVEDDGSSNGTYKVIIGGDEEKIIANEYSSYLFRGFTSLVEIDLSNFDTSDVTNMRSMFGSCSSLTSLDVSHFDTSNVTNMSYMFSGCGNLTSLDLNNLDTSKVTNMEYIFESCSSLTSLDLSNFDTSKVTNMGSMFGGCSSLTNLDLSNFDTSDVTNMDSMFLSCSSLTSLDLSNFDTSNVTNMSNMFMYCEKLTTSITIRNRFMSCNSVFEWAATAEGSQITVNYTSATSSLVDEMISTKSSNSNVVKGSLVS